jgi:hypothetical protein
MGFLSWGASPPDTRGSLRTGLRTLQYDLPINPPYIVVYLIAFSPVNYTMKQESIARGH